jgi:hypothetical protein
MHAFSESAIHTVTEPRNTPNTLTILTKEDTSMYTSKSNNELQESTCPLKPKKKTAFSVASSHHRDDLLLLAYIKMVMEEPIRSPRTLPVSTTKTASTDGLYIAQALCVSASASIHCMPWLTPPPWPCTCWSSSSCWRSPLLPRPVSPPPSTSRASLVAPAPV